MRPIAAAGLLTLVPAIAAELEALRRGCIDPTCSVVSPQIPTLTALMDIGTLLIVGGLVAEAVHDPAGAARGAASTAQGVHAAASMLVGEFAGIRV